MAQPAAGRAQAVRGGIVLRPAESWAGTLRLGGILTVDVRVVQGQPSEAVSALEVSIDGRRLIEPLRFYTPDPDAEESDSSGYRYVWNVTSLLGGDGKAHVEFRNASQRNTALELVVLKDTGVVPCRALDHLPATIFSSPHQVTLPSPMSTCSMYEMRSPIRVNRT
jgi:hypothetical protein